MAKEALKKVDSSIYSILSALCEESGHKHVELILKDVINNIEDGNI